MYTGGRLNAALEANSCICLFFDDFSNYIVTIPTPGENAHYTANSLIHQNISEFGPQKHLITARGIENFSTENINCCILFEIQHSPKNSHWKDGLDEVQNLKF